MKKPRGRWEDAVDLRRDRPGRRQQGTEKVRGRRWEGHTLKTSRSATEEEKKKLLSCKDNIQVDTVANV